MEREAIECVNKGQWGRAAEIYTKLLHLPNVSREQTISYLLARSECFWELAQHEAVVGDCRAAVRLMGDEKNDDTKYRLYQRLVYALFSLQRFGEAELILTEWAAKNTNPTKSKEASKLMEELYSKFFNQKQADSHNGGQKCMVTNVPSCTYCNLTFRDQVELRVHCQNESHQMAVMSDDGRDWYHRPPPRGYSSDSYVLCESFSEIGNCRYGMQCVEAHGMAELNEWKERFQYRLMKIQRACEKELYGKSYTEELLEQWSQSANPEMVMKENLEYVQCSCSSELAITIPTKNTSHSWEFILHTDFELTTLALLQDTYRNHFEITSVICNDLINKQNTKFHLENKQEWIGKIKYDQSLSRKEYKVVVTFRTEIFGTFRQSMIFSFGTQPVLVKHFCVDVVPITDLDKINDFRKEIILSNGNRWNSSNSIIVPFSTSSADPDVSWFKTLQNMYPNPISETFVLSQTTVVEKRLTRHNYKSRMHELLYVEELARNEEISMYNLNTKLTIAQSYVLTYFNTATTAKYATNGELFALIKVGRDLSEDTAHGRLILSNCMTVLLAPDVETSFQTVYECLIEDKGKNVIYLRIPSRAVNELGLDVNSQFSAQIQFQLNRVPYCEWHYAVDKLNDFKLIYPDVFVQPEIPWSPFLQWNDCMDPRLNVKQREAIIAISTPLYIKLPPILIIGPFGTGKTFTLAQAIKHLLLTPSNRILICTHSNSAADLYIKEYLDPYIKLGYPEATPLRIYYQKRWVVTVHETVQKYCLIDTDGMNSFRLPTIEEIKKHRIIVVTLSISMYLTRIGLPKGFFTHILLDEAAQAIECEAIMPLALATENTRIVLAGDHMQLSPEIYSKFAKERKLHNSLLERLYDHYPQNFPCKILLSENYRAHKAIIDFTSESFYDQRLVACGKQPGHENYYPLTFYTTRGEDTQDQNSTAFYNNSEVYELVERVTELKNIWPESWGKFNEHSIGIMSPYADQVFRIRTELRKRKMHGISVERVLNVQGKQFRAVFLSTVRTRRTCQQKDADELEYGFLSNSKLLNTAVTRAQSLVAVVGDPISLCTVGRCSKVWERFLQICEQNRSLFGISWSQLKSQLDGVELKKSYGLNPLAPEFVPRKFLMEAYIINSKISPSFVSPGVVTYRIQPKGMNRPTIPVFYQIPPPQLINMPPIQPLLPRPTFVPNGSYIPNINAHQKPTCTNLHQNYIVPEYSPPNIHNLMSANIQNHNPILPNVLQQHDSTIIENTQPKVPLIKEIKSQEKGMIQFMENVHFPKSMQNSFLHECVNLLPPNMTLADMITQNYQVQEAWFHHLLRTRGIETAKKFECLIHLATRKGNSVEPNPNTSDVQEQDNAWNQINMNDSVYLLENQHSKSAPLYHKQRSNPNENISPINSTIIANCAISKLDAGLSNLTIGEATNLQNNKTYASVLKTSKPITPLELINSLKPESSESGPRPYQYFV